MDFPRFNGENPKLWQNRCEDYFVMFDTDPSLYVSVAAMQFEGPAARWLQAVQTKLNAISWEDFSVMVLQRFGRNQHQSLIRRLYRLIQTGSVEEYIDQFAELVDQLSAYETCPDPLHYTTRFLDGLKPAIRSVVAIQRPVDLDTAYLLASLQEEVGDGTTVLNAPPPQQYQHRQQQYLPVPQKQSALPPIHAKDKQIQATSHAEDKLAALKAYRRAKGLCFTCGERWARDHQCKSSVQLHVVQELI
jgi:hypothetical protein